MKNLILIVLPILLTGCLNYEKEHKIKESLISLSYVPETHAFYGGKTLYNILIENLTSDTIAWQKSGFLKNHLEFPLGKPIEIYPNEKIIKSFVFFLDEDEINNLYKGSLPTFYLKNKTSEHIIGKHESFTLCNRIKDLSCFQNEEILDNYRFFNEDY